MRTARQADPKDMEDDSCLKKEEEGRVGEGKPFCS